MLNDFKEGDLAVYPSRGVGKIVKILSSKEESGGTDYYVFEMLNQNISIKVPRNKADKIGLRHITSSKKVKKILNSIKKREMDYPKLSWNKRQKHYQEKIRKGSFEDIMDVYSELLYSSQKKGLSFGEKKIMENVKQIILDEISISSGAPKDKVLQQIENIVS